MSNSVGAGYVHRDKVCTPRDEMLVSGARLKWYDIGFAEQPVPPAIRMLARAYLEREQPVLGGDFGFIVLHRCGHGDFYFLLVQTWLGDNEIWKTTFHKDRGDADFALLPLDDPHKGAFCVWEAGAVWREVNAWKRYLRSSRDAAARHAYLSELYEGAV